MFTYIKKMGGEGKISPLDFFGPWPKGPKRKWKKVGFFFFGFVFVGGAKWHKKKCPFFGEFF